MRPRKPPSPTWKTFLQNHVQDLVAMDFFVVPTVTFKVLLVLVILAHVRRRIVHVNVTEHPMETRYVLGDTHYTDPELRGQCQRRRGELVATRRGAYPHQDGGAAVRKVFHQLRSKSIEPFNGLFKGVFEWRVKMPVKGLQRSKLLALGAIVIYQLALLYQHQRALPLGQGIKPLLRAA